MSLWPEPNATPPSPIIQGPEITNCSPQPSPQHGQHKVSSLLVLPHEREASVGQHWGSLGRSAAVPTGFFTSHVTQAGSQPLSLPLPCADL